MFKIKKVRPMFNGVITTATRFVYDGTTESGIILANKLEGQINPYQIVIAKGKTCPDIEVGDIVKLNFKRYAKAKHVPGGVEDNVQSDNLSIVYELPSIEIDGKECLYMQYNDIEYVVEESEVDDGGLLQ